jgi:hypothetical protein
MQDYRCPQCRQGDSVSKVSTLVSSGSAGYEVAQTDLASKLRAPSNSPTYQSPWRWFSVLFVLVAFSLGGLSAFLVVYFWLLWFPGGYLYNPGAVIGFHVAAIVLMSIVVITVIYKVNEAKRRKEWVTSIYPRWQRARELWDELYYCARNDIVFLPDRPGAYAPASEMDSFLQDMA